MRAYGTATSLKGKRKQILLLFITFSIREGKPIKNPFYLIDYINDVVENTNKKMEKKCWQPQKKAALPLGIIAIKIRGLYFFGWL